MINMAPEIFVVILIPIVLSLVVLGIYLYGLCFEKYDKSIKIRQHKLVNTDCTFEQAVSEIQLVNEMSECNYGIADIRKRTSSTR